MVPVRDSMEFMLDEAPESDNWVVLPRPSNGLYHARPRDFFWYPHYPVYSDLYSHCQHLFFVQLLVRKCKEQKERSEMEIL